MRGSGSGICLSVAVALALSCVGAVGKADGLGIPVYSSSLVVADNSLAAESLENDVFSFTSAESYSLSPSMIANSSPSDASASDEVEQTSVVPEPSGIVLGAFFAALFALVSLLRWRFDHNAVKS